MLVSMLYTIVNAWTVINDEICSEYIVMHVQACVYQIERAAYTVMFCVCARVFYLVYTFVYDGET